MAVNRTIKIMNSISPFFRQWRYSSSTPSYVPDIPPVDGTCICFNFKPLINNVLRPNWKNEFSWIDKVCTGQHNGARQDCKWVITWFSRDPNICFSCFWRRCCLWWSLSLHSWTEGKIRYNYNKNNNYELISKTHPQPINKYICDLRVYTCP